MKFPAASCIALGLLFCGCAGSGDPSKPAVFDALHPGGPVYAPQEIVVEKPVPEDTPFGSYFDEPQKAAPAGFSDPYWIRGYWGWKNGDWEWIPGRWVQRPRPGLIWVNAHTYTSGSRIFWQTGYWQ